MFKTFYCKNVKRFSKFVSPFVSLVAIVERFPRRFSNEGTSRYKENLIDRVTKDYFLITQRIRWKIVKRVSVLGEINRFKLRDFILESFLIFLVVKLK